MEEVRQKCFSELAWVWVQCNDIVFEVCSLHRSTLHTKVDERVVAESIHVCGEGYRWAGLGNSAGAAIDIRFGRDEVLTFNNANANLNLHPNHIGALRHTAGEAIIRIICF